MSIAQTIRTPMFWLEATAVVFGACYTLLITYGIIWCWPAAIISSLIFTYLCFNKRIYADTALQLFYIAIAIYGWATWGANAVDYQKWGWENHLITIALGAGFTILIAWLLRKYTDAFWPGVDTLIAVFSVLATFMMVWAVTDNWYYWIVIDSLSIFLFASRRMYLTSFLFFIYTLLAINGAIQWSQAAA